jgi:hypothetical protein
VDVDKKEGRLSWLPRLRCGAVPGGGGGGLSVSTSLVPSPRTSPPLLTTTRFTSIWVLMIKPRDNGQVTTNMADVTQGKSGRAGDRERFETERDSRERDT